MSRSYSLLPLLLLVATSALSQAPLAWDQTRKFRYEIPAVTHDANTRTVTVVYRVTNPEAANAPYELLGANVATPFRPPATLRVLLAWNAGSWGAAELVNTKSDLAPLLRTVTGGIVTGSAPAAPISLNALSAATARRCSDAGSPCSLIANPTQTYWVTAVLPATASGAGRAGIEGHPSIQTGTDPLTGAALFTSVPVQSIFRDFAITAGAAPRRTIVEFNKCQGCHDDRRHGDTVVPRLSLHGANRNEAPGVCVMCHNPDQTDAAYRTSGPEESVDFKRMIHGIHAGERRRTPLIIIGRNGSVNDFSHVKFPTELRNCLTCHIESNGKGTFELPLATKLGSTINTLSQLNVTPGQIDVNPANNLRISPIAATCSPCHDDAETRQHMIRTGGASFGVEQGALAGKEQCVTCHGPGRTKDVRRVHEVRSSSHSGSSSSTTRRRDD